MINLIIKYCFPVKELIFNSLFNFTFEDIINIALLYINKIR